MNKEQRDLLSAVYNKNINPDYMSVRGYAYNFNKYNKLTMRDIDEVVAKLKELLDKESNSLYQS